MRVFFFTLGIIAICFSNGFPLKGPAKEFDPEVHLKKADEAVKLEPLRAMDISQSALMLLRGSDNEFLELKARLIIGKAHFFLKEYQKALKVLSGIKARITVFHLQGGEEKFDPLSAESFFWLGEVYLKLSRYKKSLESYRKGIQYLNKRGGTVLESRLLTAVARLNILLSEYEEAIHFSIRASRSAEISRDVESRFFSQYLHGYAYREMKDYSKALLKFRSSLKTAEKNNRVDLKVMALNEISNISILREEYGQALALKEKALKIAEQTDNRSAVSFCLHDIALIFRAKKEYGKAIPYLLRSRQMAVEDNTIRAQVITDQTIAETYLWMGQKEKGRKIAEAALKTARKHDLKSETMDLSEFLSEIELKSGRYKNAYYFLKSSFDLNQEIFSTEKSSRIAELEAEIEMEKSESRILLLEKVNEIKQMELEEKDNFITLQKVATLFLIIIVVLVFLAYRMKIRANLQLKKKSDELEKTLREIHHLSGLLPICSSCKKIRDDGGYWHQVEEYIKSHSEASFSHSLCPSCVDKVYPGRKNGKKTASKKGTGKKK